MKKQKRFIKKNWKTIVIGILTAIVTIACLYALQILGALIAGKTFLAEYPEVLAVRQAIGDTNKYSAPSVTVNWHSSYHNGKEKTSTSLTVLYHSNSALTENEANEIRSIACDVLYRLDKKYDNIVVVSNQSLLPSFIPFYLNINEAFPGSCK